MSGGISPSPLETATIEELFNEISKRTVNSVLVYCMEVQTSKDKQEFTTMQQGGTATALGLLEIGKNILTGGLQDA